MNPLKSVRVWLYGLLSSVISSAAGVTAVIAIDPVDFNLSTGLRKVGQVAFVMGLIALFNYLQRHPLPTIDDPETDPHVGV